MPSLTCSVFDVLAVQRYNMPPCEHVAATLALFADLDYSCDERFWRNDTKERVHRFAHGYTIAEQRAYILYRMASSVEDGGRWLAPSICLSEAHVASGIAQATTWSAKAEGNSMPSAAVACNHPAHALYWQDGHIVCGECGEDQGEGLSVEEMQTDIADLIRMIEARSAMETIIGSRVAIDHEGE